MRSLGFDAFPQVAGWEVDPVLLDFEVHTLSCHVTLLPQLVLCLPFSPATPRDSTGSTWRDIELNT